jgi:trimethylamine--corrinoid protein Co-methyltransferase
MPKLQPLRPGCRVRILSDAQLGQFKLATLEILESRFPLSLPSGADSALREILENADMTYSSKRGIAMHSTTPDIIPFRTPFTGRMLSEDQVEILREGTLHVLEQVGVLFPSEQALEIFAQHGADVDFETQIVRIPPDLVHEAMSTAPRSFVLGGREPRFDLTLDGQASYLCTVGTGVHVIDSETRQQRASRKSDIEMMAQVCDALPMICFFWPLVGAQDYGDTARLHEAHAGLTNTLKHVRGSSTMHPRLSPYFVEMATVIAGDDETRRARPPVCANICTIAPLAQDKHGLESALIYAEAGIPVSFMAMPNLGSTAPASVLGALVMGDAEVISAMVLLQLAHPGAPVFHAVFSSLMDPRTGGYISQLPTPSYAIARQLAESWGVPCLGGARLGSDAPAPGWQSGVDLGMGAVAMALSGGDVCGGIGLEGSSTILYPEAIVMDHEAVRDAYEQLRGFEFDPDDMALEVIREVGPRGHYLRQTHTREHIRDFRLPAFRPGRTAHEGIADHQEAALQMFKEILETHEPEPLPAEKLDELDRLLLAAEKEELE